MAYFAQIDGDNIVVQVIVVADSDAPDGAAGVAFCKSLLGADTNWVETKTDGSVNTRYAGIGMYYDSARDAFYHPQPYDNWVFNETRKSWEPPVARPSDYDTVPYTWNQSSGAWVGDS
jgi:hypothetical protein